MFVPDQTHHHAGSKLDPAVLKIDSERVHASLNGWRTTDGIRLREPAYASVQYTPALAK